MENIENITGMLVKHIASDILKEADRVISNEEPLISSGLIDSFSLVDLALMVEDLFDVQIDDSELNSDTFDTVSQLASIIIKRLPGK
jgi:acyl carrier protein